MVVPGQHGGRLAVQLFEDALLLLDLQPQAPLDHLHPQGLQQPRLEPPYFTHTHTHTSVFYIGL